MKDMMKKIKLWIALYKAITTHAQMKNILKLIDQLNDFYKK